MFVVPNIGTIMQKLYVLHALRFISNIYFFIVLIYMWIERAFIKFKIE